jgi:hypothetical protein
MRLLALALIMTCFTQTRLPAEEPRTPPRVKLAVLVTFDQMRGDFVVRWQEQFGSEGFQRIQRDGAWFSECHYPYSTTATGPGHASMLTGTSPDRHGIIGNEWYDVKAAQQQYCAGMARYQTVPASPAVKIDPKSPKSTSTKPKYAGTPDLLLAETIADRLKATTSGKAKVFGLSLKDRSAILPVGKKPDGAYWFNGKFVTSTYYRDAVHPWVEQFNKSGVAESYFEKTWDRFKPNLNYDKLAGPDDVVGEAKGVKQGITFPHSMKAGLEKVGKDYYDALATSPYGNSLLFEFAKACIEAEQLGQDDIPDLLSLSFSSNDLVGHAWGPDSHEVLDITLRSDAIMQELLTYLDAKVGKGQYSVVLTADHGICPLPEVSAAKGIPAKRISPLKLLLGAEKHLSTVFGELPKEDKPADPAPETPDEKGETPSPKKTNRWIEALGAPSVYLNHKLITAKKLDPARVAEELGKYFAQQEGILTTFTRTQLEDKSATDDPLLQRSRRNYMASRSGDLYVVLEPYYLLGSSSSGTNHGTPHAYDTHVPLMVFGPGLNLGKSATPVTPQHATPILAHFLAIPTPKQCDYGVPEGLFRK